MEQVQIVLFISCSFEFEVIDHQHNFSCWILFVMSHEDEV
jgi:hypothetical protein